MPVVVGVVVFLLLLAAVCGLLAMWTILHDLRAGARRHRMVAAPVGAALAVVPRRIGTPPGVPLLPPPLPRRLVHASPTLLARDDEEEDDYTEVDDGVTIISDRRLPARR